MGSAPRAERTVRAAPDGALTGRRLCIIGGSAGVPWFIRTQRDASDGPALCWLPPPRRGMVYWEISIGLCRIPMRHASLPATGDQTARPGSAHLGVDRPGGHGSLALSPPHRCGRLHAVSIASAPNFHMPGMKCEVGRPALPENTSVGQGGTMSTTLTAICSAPGTDCVMRSRRANARLAPAARKRAWERDTQVARSPRAGEAARWQRILDLLNPGNAAGVAVGHLGGARWSVPAPPRRSPRARKRRNRMALVRRKVLKPSLMGHTHSGRAGTSRQIGIRRLPESPSRASGAH
jgi:hypothetical protein